METQQSGHDPRSRPEVKIEEVVPKMARRRGSEGGELVPIESVRRRCKKNAPSVLSCIGKRTREGCDRGNEVRTVHSGQNGKGQFFREDRRNLAEEGVVKAILSRRVTGMPIA